MLERQRYIVPASSAGVFGEVTAKRDTHLGQGDTVTDNNIATGQIREVRDEVTGDEGQADIYRSVTAISGHNFRGARVPVPSGLCMEAWRRHLQGYADHNLPDFLEFGWPIHCQPTALLTLTWHSHPSATQRPRDIQHYIVTERVFGPLGGPYVRQPFTYMQLSPLMTKDRKVSEFKRVIMD